MADANQNDLDDENILLLKAIRNNNLKIVQLLLKNNFGRKTLDETDPLYLAIELGYLSIVDAIVSHDPSYLHIKYGEYEITPLELSIKFHQTEIIKFLQDNYAPGDYWHYVAAYSDVEELKQIDNVDVLGKWGYTPLFNTIEFNNYPNFEYLINLKANVNHRTDIGETPLHFAIIFNNIKMAEKLLSLDVNVNAADNSLTTPLMGAVIQNSHTLFKLLMAHGAEIDLKNEYEETCLALAHFKNTIGMLPTILSYKPNVNVADEDGRTPLHRVAANGFVDAVQLLINHGADINRRCKELYKPIYDALIENHLEVTKLLLLHGADLDSNITLDFVSNADYVLVELVLNAGFKWYSLDPSQRGLLKRTREYLKSPLTLMQLCRISLRNGYGRNYIDFVTHHDSLPVLIKQYLRFDEFQI